MESTSQATSRSRLASSTAAPEGAPAPESVSELWEQGQRSDRPADAGEGGLRRPPPARPLTLPGRLQPQGEPPSDRGELQSFSCSWTALGRPLHPAQTRERRPPAPCPRIFLSPAQPEAAESPTCTCGLAPISSTPLSPLISPRGPPGSGQLLRGADLRQEEETGAPEGGRLQGDE